MLLTASSGSSFQNEPAARGPRGRSLRSRRARPGGPSLPAGPQRRPGAPHSGSRLMDSERSCAWTSRTSATRCERLAPCWGASLLVLPHHALPVLRRPAPAPPLPPPPASQQLTEPEPGPPAKAAAEERITDGAEARCACEAGSRQETARQAASETGGGGRLRRGVLETGDAWDGAPRRHRARQTRPAHVTGHSPAPREVYSCGSRPAAKPDASQGRACRAPGQTSWDVALATGPGFA